MIECRDVRKGHSYIARLILPNEQRTKIFHDYLLVSVPLAYRAEKTI